MNKRRTTSHFIQRLTLLALCALPLSTLADEVTVADQNGNELTYSFETADGPATFKAVKTYAADEAKKGRIVIADAVTDGDGNSHEVKYVSGSVGNRADIVSIVFGQNIVSTGGADGQSNDAFFDCDKLESVTLNAKLEILGRFTFQNCNKLTSVDLTKATSLKTIRYRCFQATPLRSITIPATVEEIEEDQFGYNDSLRTVTFLAAEVPNSFCRSHNKLEAINLGAGVKRIGQYAFANSRGLQSLNINSDVSGLAIGQCAFTECDILRSVSLPQGVASMELCAFYSCDSLRTVTFQGTSTLKTIPQSCFAYCISLPTITIPDGVETVEYEAFYGCHELTEVTFGTGLKKLSDNYQFSYCEKLRKVVLPGTAFPFTGNHGLHSEAVLYVHPELVDTYRESDYTKAYHIMAIGQPTEFAVTTTAGGQLQAKVEAIGPAYNVLQLTVSGPLNGTDIDYIHRTMTNVEVLNLTAASIVPGGDSYHQWNVAANGTATIETYYGPWNTEKDVISRCMFYNMPTLRSLSLPAGATAIGEWACAQDRNTNLRLQHIDLPAGVDSIARSAFRWAGITEVTVPAGVKRLELETFYNCRNLKRATLPDGITYIGVSCFSECQLLEDVNIPAKVETIENYAFYNNNVRTTPIVLPATLKRIGDYAFQYNRLVKQITFSEGLETIGGYAFNNCNALESLVLPESITRIGNDAFEGCDSLTSFVFPASMKEVPYAMFYHCDKLQRVTLAAGTTSIGAYAFQNCPALSDINLTEQTALTSMGIYAFANTGLVNVTLPDQISKLDYCAFRECLQLQSINIPTSLTAVPYDFVAGCPKLTSVKMHNGIRTIGHIAFENCTSLATIDLNDQITDIEYRAFKGCSALQLTKLPSALTHIGSEAFRGTASITGTLTIPEDVTAIDKDAFWGCGLSAVIIPEGTTAIGEGAFRETPNLARVVLPSKLETIKFYTFYKATALRGITLPDSLRRIEYNAFDLSALESIELPEGVNYIGDYAFASTQLRTFRVPDGFDTGDFGAYALAYNKRLKSVYMGRNMDYTAFSYFTAFHQCDSLELLRLYAGTPPNCLSNYFSWRQNCVLEVPEDAVELYQQTDVWKDFKEIRGFFMGDVLNAQDYAALQELYEQLDGTNWKNTWDMSNDHHAANKWAGVSTSNGGGTSQTYFVTAIDLSEQQLNGYLPASVFRLPRLQTLNLAHNQISGDLATVASGLAVGTTAPLTELNLQDNQLTGDLYPLVACLPDLTTLNVSYNQLTDISQPLPKDKLTNDYNRLITDMQFVDWQTKEAIAPTDSAASLVTDITPGMPTAIELPTIMTYNHSAQNYSCIPSELARIYKNGSSFSIDWELRKNSDGLWMPYQDNSNNVLRVKKGVVEAFTNHSSWWEYHTLLLRFTWDDGDVNADQTVDVADLQSVIYYALNDRKPNQQMFNFTDADANTDQAIDVRDVVGNVDRILAYDEPAASRARIYNKVKADDGRNLFLINGDALTLCNTDAVATLQLHVSGARAEELTVGSDLRGAFSVSMRNVADGVRIVVYSAAGHTLAPGEHYLLTSLPAGSTITDARLADADARHLGFSLAGTATAVEQLSNSKLSNSKCFDLYGRPLGEWSTLPQGVYILNVNGKQVKVKK